MFEEALKINPNYSAALAALGNISLNEGKLTEALDYFVKAVEENPGIEIVDTMPSALSSEHGIVRFDSNDNKLNAFSSFNN